MRLTPILSVVLLGLLGGGCRSESGGLDRQSAEAVFAAAMRATATEDLAALEPLLTAEGKQGLERLLREWQKQLRDPAKSRFILERVRERRGTLDPAEVELAQYGTPEDVWRFYLRAEPRVPAPRSFEPRVAPDGQTVVIEYEGPQGIVRAVRLVRVSEGWAIADLGL